MAAALERHLMLKAAILMNGLLRILLDNNILRHYILGCSLLVLYYADPIATMQAMEFGLIDGVLETEY